MVDMVENSNKQWYVLQVFSAQEKKVKKTIEESLAMAQMTDLVGQVLVPTEHVSEVKNGKQRIVERLMWPGYVYINMRLTDESWTYIKNCNGVISFLGGDKPVPMTNAEIEQLLGELDSKKEKVTQKHQLEAGDLIKINEGAFVNFTGTVNEVNAEKGLVSVRVAIFGRETLVELEIWQVEKVTAESE